MKQKRGFASMSPAVRSAIAQLGGQAAHACGRAHQFSHDEAIAAGKLGGLAVSQDREHMAALGRLGGRKRAENIAKRKAET